MRFNVGSSPTSGAMRKCRSCSVTISDSRKESAKFCGLPCKNKYYVRKYRRDSKVKLVALKGGKCFDCGVVFPPYVFHFDHRDPSTKSFGISSTGLTRKFSDLVCEVEKCDLVCANCHAVRTYERGDCAFRR